MKNPLNCSSDSVAVAMGICQQWKEIRKLYLLVLVLLKTMPNGNAGNGWIANIAYQMFTIFVSNTFYVVYIKKDN